MKLKRFALRGLIILAVAVAVCMYFARTVQTITTPKVRLVNAGSGRFEEKMSFTGEVFFPEKEDITVEEAAKTSVTVKRVWVRPGQWVTEGDTVFTCEISGQEETLKKLRDDLDAKTKELLELDVSNKKLSRSSEQNQLYDAMADSYRKLTELTVQAKTLAAREKVTLTGEVSSWKRQLSVQKNVPAEVNTAVEFVLAAQKQFAADQEAYFAITEDRQRKVSDSTFEYISKRNGLLESMEEISDQMVEENLRAEALQTITAPRDGYIVEVAVKEGEAYDGSKAAYTMSGADSEPVLRASLEGVQRTIAQGARADITVGESTQRSTVDRTQADTDGTKYLWIAIPEELLQGGASGIRQLMNSGGVAISITYRAKENSTLLPPSAVRNEGDSDYVYLVQQSWGDGFMNAAGMRVVKTNVTVLERGDKAVSISEDLSYQQVADREDRALTDGQAVMEYVN